MTTLVLSVCVSWSSQNIPSTDYSAWCSCVLESGSPSVWISRCSSITCGGTAPIMAARNATVHDRWVNGCRNVSCLFRFFHRPRDGSEVMYDPVSVMNADILNYCQKESWCKLGFYLISFFYYLYRWVHGQLFSTFTYYFTFCAGKFEGPVRKNECFLIMRPRI